MSITIAQLMDESGVGFGTSGARGLADAMTDRVCYAYTVAFLQLFESRHIINKGDAVAIAGDLRSSTPRIIQACIAAIEDQGYQTIYCGCIPTPALALLGLDQEIASLMVTGSHIPDDRNGIKFYKPAGEIMKDDEVGMRGQSINVPDNRFGSDELLISPNQLPEPDQSARLLYQSRFTDFFHVKQFEGLRIGLYQHSSVVRDMLTETLEALGAEVICLGRSDNFIPVDTEAIRAEDIVLAKNWSQEFNLDVIVSTDGDGDRPLVSDENGQWLRGDIVGMLCARYLGAQVVVTPVSSNSVVEKSDYFSVVKRTKIGSPYVIAAMDDALSEGLSQVVGYEANGGFLQADSLTKNGHQLTALPTRDACIVIFAVIAMAKDSGDSISSLLEALPSRFTYSDRLKNVATSLSQEKIKYFTELDEDGNHERVESIFGPLFGKVSSLDMTDGLRISFDSEEVVHLRPSGNAPELRCYNEASTASRAQEMNVLCLSILKTWCE